MTQKINTCQKSLHWLTNPTKSLNNEAWMNTDNNCWQERTARSSTEPWAKALYKGAIHTCRRAHTAFTGIAAWLPCSIIT